ncbi:hypothetical protein CONCODRAFT_82953 [Conidiobolus coronatus NRRL 28638]|uniref:Cleavage/polyadenylation specificity factor A subunit N-terminal domain-containing protein n=1 Tax=Conidiobolus coronatus (strain ATCC 28846 / CBS 209.66 / NRRL 28638) TaxID=796925 RepID=A0A137PHM4_CONC2|nr:hypothetical protein CONCODRAFT_82953 [Conidiobolus coronatus NRRL 28638]|eukprot:KXN74503.1 hypothetical protein CONCODRAFT_82953 [Conidiobolus coronatus NRRL 28638]
MTELKTSVNSSQKKNKLKQTKEEDERNQLEAKVEEIELKVIKSIETNKLGSQVTYIQFGNLSSQTLNNYIILATDKGELIKLDSNGEIKELKKLFGSSSPVTSLKLLQFINSSNESSLISVQLNGKLNFYLKFQLCFQLEIGNSPTCLEKVIDSNNGYYLVIGDNLGKVTGFDFKGKLFQFFLKEPKLTFIKGSETPSLTLETSNNPIDQVLFVNIKDLSNNLGYYYLISNFSNKAYIYSKSTHIHTIYLNNEITRMTKGKFTELTCIKSDNEEDSKVLDILISDSTGQVYLLNDLKPTPYLNHGSPIQFMEPYRIKGQASNTSDYLIITDYSNIVYIYQNQKLITRLPLAQKINQLLTISSNGFLSDLEFNFNENLEDLEFNYTNNDLILLLLSDNNLVILGADFIKMEVD